MHKKISKKQQVMTKVFEECHATGQYIFDNTLVKKVAEDMKFANPFDATKLDRTKLFPKVLMDNDYFVIHIGEGKHRFVKGIARGFHEFEPVESAEDWPYQASILNEYDSSESNVLSVAFNQRLIHKFLYGDMKADPKMYLPRRTKASFDFCIAKEKLHANKVQMEIDCTTEHNGTVTIFECKNGFPKDFAVYQLYFPFLYYYQLKKANQLAIKNIDCCYLLRNRVGAMSKIKMYRYTFADPYDMTSILLRKSAHYNLKRHDA